VPIKVAKKSDADYHVTGEFNENVWSIRLIDLKTKKVVWLEKLKIEKEN
jgi:PBP1b-binding outer membrane lipoprotein LpoB